jgi:hypothetical protein
MKSVNEMVLGLAAVLFASLVTIGARAETVINYDDGSTYTLKENQEIYISRLKVPLFTRSFKSNKDTFFHVQKPWTKRDYVPDEDGTDEMAVGSHEWCKAYIPWHEGLTFNMISWQRACDTNKDGKYGCGDEGFDNSADAGVCN